MRSPRTAKDDQPGPICRRHNSTGGEVDQSVLMRVPRMVLSRSAPRKPGHSAFVSAATGVRGGATGWSLALALWAAGVVAGIVTGAGAGGSTESLPPGCAMSRSSCVFDQRQAKSEEASPVMPFVRRSVHAPHASKMVATIDARRSPSERRWLTIAQPTKARQTVAMEYIANMNPIIPATITFSL